MNALRTMVVVLITVSIPTWDINVTANMDLYLKMMAYRVKVTAIVYHSPFALQTHEITCSI